MVWTWADCPSERCAQGIEVGTEDTERLCPHCRGYGAQPVRAYPLETAETFRTRREAWAWIARTE